MQNIIFFQFMFELFIVLNIQTVYCKSLQRTVHNYQKYEIEEGPERFFTTSFEGFFPLIDRDYLSKSLKYDHFGKKVSLSMYRYYMVQHLYVRLLYIRSDRSLTNNQEEEYVDYVISNLPLVPTEILSYLTAIGDIKSINGHNKTSLKYSSIVWPNENGNFGRISHNNHWMYMSFPAPCVVSQAISEDYHHTMMPLKGNIWNLRHEIAPSISGAGYPTANLLGWKPAIILTPEQQQILELYGINGHTFDNTYPKFQVNRHLLEYIKIVLHKFIRPSELFSITSRYYNAPPAFTYRKAQLGWLERDTDDEVSFSRTARYIDHHMKGRIFSPYDYYIADETMNAAFRVNKSKIVHDWCIYEFDKYKNVPLVWVRSRNHLFKIGNITVDETVELAPSFQ